MRVLICDDEPSIRELYRFAFEQAGALVGEAADGNECIETARRDHPDMIVLDLFMPDRDGLSALPDLRRECPAAPVLMVSAHAGVEVFDRARSLGAAACFEKGGFLRRIPQLVDRWDHPTAGDALFYRGTSRAGTADRSRTNASN
ncbi:MAG: response regulator [Actinobacteria bacterium]|nr:response regulator [Actinomycetota bacterium]